MNTQRILLPAVLGAVLGTTAVQAQHINAGALGTNQGDQLYFENGASFVNTSGYTKTLTYATTGTYVGYIQGSITFTASARTALGGETPSPTAAALGSFLELGIVSVTGPDGGQFAFWDAGATTPTFSYASGFSVASPVSTWDLSDPATAGDPGEDPFGHLHGRRLTATVPGSYTVGFKIVDTSVNGTGGGPIHSASETFLVNFTAVPEPEEYAAVAAAALVGFALWRRRANRA
jgi:MYXO-CTERM domain-containing protein